jgi:hypothetical protein
MDGYERGRRMKDRIAEIAARIWSAQREELEERVGLALQNVKKLLEIEDHYRHGHSDQSRLGSSLGGFRWRAL